MKEKSKRGNFTSSFGFVLAAAGSAVGLGNLWKFPYIAGESGGGVFMVFYLVFILILGVPFIMSETAIGRKTQLSTIGAYRSINPKWTFAGIIGVVCAFFILSYYSVVGGWILKYITVFFTSGHTAAAAPGYFASFTANPVEPVVWHLVFMAFCTVVVLFGVEKGIEKGSKIMLPALFVLIVIVAVRSLTLGGNAMEGVKFLFIPDFSQLDSPSKVANVAVQAMGQVFFSLSIGMGISITYGSYLKKDSNLVKNSFIIGGLDTLVALLAGLAIMPAVFAFGFEPAAGPSLIFETLPAVFDSMPLGNLFAVIFFILVFFAAATSAIALLEVVSSFFIDSLGWKRSVATISTASVMALIGVFASLSFGPLKDATLFGMGFFDFLSYLTDKILMPLGALAMCLFVGYSWKPKSAAEELAIGRGGFRAVGLYSALMRFVAPALVIIIFVAGLINK